MAENPDETTLLTRLNKFLSRVDEDDDDEGGAGRLDRNPRFRQVLQRAKAAEKELAEMRAEDEALSKLQAKQLEELKKNAAKEVADVEARLQKAHQVDIALRDMGLDEDGRAEVRRVHKGADPDNKSDPAAWWRNQLDVLKKHREDPEKVEAPKLPRTLSAYLPGEDSGGGGGGGGGPTSPAAVVGLGVHVDEGVVGRRKAAPADKLSKAQSFDELMRAAAELDG